MKSGDFVTPSVRLVRPLAEGGMGRVWVAEHLGLHAQVVVKTMSEEIAERPDGFERFAREAAAAAAIKSPNVVQVFDHGRTAEGVPYIVMELLEGKDLGAQITEHGPLPVTTVMEILVQVGRALSKAHKAGIVHRDIKPDNIFICDSEPLLVKLLDFGTAKRDMPASSRTTVPGLIMGTPYYMSPEQSIGADIDERSDIWSLGIVAFEALTGRKPFDGPSVGAITIAIHGALPKIGLAPALDEWFARCCSQDPNDRFPTVRDATNAFVVAVTGESPIEQPTESLFFPVPAHKDSTPPRPVTRHIEPLTASLGDRGGKKTTLAMLVVGGAAALAMAGILLHRPSAPPAASEPVQAAAPPPAAVPPPPPVVEPPPAPPEPAPPPEHGSPGTKAASGPVHSAHIASKNVAAPPAGAPAKGHGGKAALPGASAPVSPAAAPAAAAAAGKPEKPGKGAPAKSSDDDLLKLQKAAEQAAPAPAADKPASPAEKPAPPAEKPAADPPPLPAQ